MTILQAEKRMGAGMVERHGPRPGRPFDAPAFTVRAFAGGTEPGGFIWRLSDGSTRKMTTDEAYVLMGYPKGFAGSMAGAGNAVPPPLAEAILKELWND